MSNESESTEHSHKLILTEGDPALTHVSKHEDIFANEAEHLLDENEKEFEEQNTKPSDPFDLLNEKDIDMFQKFCDHMVCINILYSITSRNYILSNN